MSTNTQDSPLATCRVACRDASSDYTHVQPGVVDGECVCYRPFEAPENTAEVLPGIRRYACIASNVDTPLVDQVGMSYVGQCQPLPLPETSARYSAEVDAGGWTTAEAREALASGAWKLMDHDAYLCVDARCVVRAALSANAASSSVAPTTATDAPSTAAGDTVAVVATSVASTTAAAQVADASPASVPPATTPPPPATASLLPPSAPTMTVDAERQSHAARAIVMRTPQQPGGYQYVPPTPSPPPSRTPPAGSASSTSTTGNGTNALASLGS